MARMIELIRDSAVPATVMRSAARGALSLPAAEVLEILVMLSSHPLWGEQATLTLAGWDPGETARVAADSQAPPSVLEYLSSPANLRPQILPSLLENPAIPESRIMELVRGATPELLPVLAASARIRSCPEAQRIVQARGAVAAVDGENQLGPEDGAEAGGTASAEEPFPELEAEIREFMQTHEEELKEESAKPFQLLEATAEEQADIAEARSPAPGLAATVAAAHALGSAGGGERERLSTIQKISRMSIGERVQLAYRSNQDERFILIRDGARVVSAAVLESPKLTEAEVEVFAGMKNVGEHVLRIIASKRKYKRNYALKRLLTANPRCPVDVAIPLIKELLMSDLKNLMANKNVSDIVRTLAFKTLKDKSKSRG